jgi:hypothetical protein
MHGGAVPFGVPINHLRSFVVVSWAAVVASLGLHDAAQLLHSSALLHVQCLCFTSRGSEQRRKRGDFSSILAQLPSMAFEMDVFFGVGFCSCV